jgi:hypothetical protein
VKRQAFVLALLLLACGSPKQTMHDGPNGNEAIVRTPLKKESKPTAQNDLYIKKYAGVYAIKVDADKSGQDEKLLLELNGNCTWRYGGQAKYGKWSAVAGIIRTIVKGNSGDIPEDFTLQNGKFVSGDSKDRYLKKLKLP